jgi:tetratricopeptide (TPR) repeat protein
VLLSVLYADQERYFDAIFQVEALRKFGPLSDDNYASLGSYYGEVELPEKAIGVLMEGYAKFPKSMPIINNLAYFLLMEGHTAQAKEILNARPHNVDDHVEMVATLGLLHLKEGDYDAARRLYKRAENLAARSSRKPLAKAVRQKMHLELARYHAARAEYSSALREIIAGLKEKYGRGSFVKQLKELEQSLQSLE